MLLTILPVFWPKMPPIGLASLKDYLKEHGIQSDVLDLNVYFYNLVSGDLKRSWIKSCNTALEKNILSVLDKEAPGEFQKVLNKLSTYDCLGFSCFKSNLNFTLETAQIIKSKNSNIRILLGGPEITRQYFKTKGVFDEYLKSLADLLVVGEGELPLKKYLSGEITEKVSLFDELETLSDVFPKYDGFEVPSYPRKGSISLIFSRGCVRRCAFCSERLLYKGFRSRSVSGLLEEIAYHKEKNISDFVFHDSMFNGDLKKLNEFCDGVMKRFGSINWEAQVGIRTDMPDKLFEKMKKSGCYNLFVGLESGCARTLDNMRKGFAPDDARAFFRKLKKAELNFGVSFIVGYPGETEKDFKESLSFMIENKDLIPKVEQVNPFTHYDGTEVFETMEERGSLNRLEIFIAALKDNGIRYTNAFIGNLIEK